MDYIRSPNQIQIFMDYYPDGDLQQMLTGPMPEDGAAKIVRQILEGLDFMHDAKIAHRDLKPGVCHQFQVILNHPSTIAIENLICAV